jgi:hypothetical protein
MRNLSAGALTKILTQKGTEPIFIVEIDWGVGGSPKRYADRTVGSIPGRILEVGALDNVVNVLTNTSSQEIHLVLDDHDGTIKSIIDTSDVHERTVRVYQYFDGLSLSDKFLLFSGKISSPIEWSESSRSFSFSVVSQLEDKEFGFSVEEGDFEFIPRDLVGKPWPVCFGLCLDVPALRINQAVSGTTLCGVGILSGEDLQRQVPLSNQDCSLGQSLATMSAHISILNIAATAWDGPWWDNQRSDDLRDQANQLRAQMAVMVASHDLKNTCGESVRESKLENATNSLGCNPVRILGGEDFPQGTTLTLNINGGLFIGSFSGDLFTITGRRHLENEARAQELFDNVEESLCEQPTPAAYFDFTMEVPDGYGDFSLGPDVGTSTLRRHGFVICTTTNKSKPSATQIAQHFWADGGSRVTIAGAEPQYFIASITPGEVLAVKAWKQFEGERRLVNVPNNLWATSLLNIGPFTATLVRTTKPLSSIEGQGWEDDVYVTFEGTIGPNTVDILRYIIDTWTDLSYDATSFNSVETKLDPFPSNFAVLDRKDTLQVLQEIAFQARCAIWLDNGVFHLKYLPEEPASDETIDISDIEFESVAVTTDSTEDLVTKMIIRWRLTYAEDASPMILRNNVKKYGTKTQEFDWYIYNQPDIIHKCATFWLIRLSNTWKKIRFKGFLNLLRLETFDTVTLNLGTQRYVANGSVKAIVSSAEYDSDTNTIAFECLCPVRFGEMTAYNFFWPASATGTFPTAADIAAGYAGGNGVGAAATGTLPIGDTGNLSGTGAVIIGGPNILFRGRSDRGDPTPQDTGFVAQTVAPTEVYANLSTEQNPDPDLTLNYIEAFPSSYVPPAPSVHPSVIDIRTTRIVDGDNPDREALLSTIIRSISEDNKLVIDTESLFGDAEENEDVFHFRYDTDNTRFAAGSAFLLDEEPAP